jgi:hypothetical protein
MVTSIPASKTCNKCRKSLDLASFYKTRNSTDGLKRCCKACAETYRRNLSLARGVKPHRVHPSPVNGGLVCHKCHQEKTTEHFYLEPRRRSGFSYLCKSCISEYSKERSRRRRNGMVEYYASNRALIPQGIKQCLGCTKVLPLSDFGPVATCAGGVAPRCRPCTNVMQNNRYKAKRIKAQTLG